MSKPTVRKSAEMKSPIASGKREKQYEIVQLWRKRGFAYADPNDATEEEMAVSKYKANCTFLLVKINQGFNMDGTPRYKVEKLELPDSSHPNQLTQKRGSDVVESRFGIAISSFRVHAKKEEVVKSLQEHPLCWQPGSADPWKADKNGKGFYVREITDMADTRSALERAVSSDGSAPTMEQSRDPQDLYEESDEVIFEDSEVEELVS